MLGKRWPKFLLIIVGIILITTKVTDADLIAIEYIRDHIFMATTLDFSHRQTANDFPTSTLFNVTGLIPGGFQVESVRIKKEGVLNFDYQITTEVSGTQSSLCRQLELKVFHNWQSVYSGQLLDFALHGSVDELGADNLVLAIILPSEANVSGSCDFNFKVITTEIDPAKPQMFSDEEILQNHISAIN